MTTERNPYSSSRTRAWTGIVLGFLGVLCVPAAVYVSDRSNRVGLLDAAYAVPFAFVLGVLAFGMASRARHNLAWLRLDGRGTKAAALGVFLGVLALAVAVTAALSVGFYEAIVYYQRHH
ncbi:MAG TPA: hypothetical protein VEH52_14900 [Gaiellaceae bacterium]|nr:hypothetical protein [Gaiellaceae bacterium]